MSFIHEALKKAQKEKDARYREHDEIVSTAGHKPRIFSRKALWGGSFLLISLAFTAYLWLPSGGKQPPIREPATPKATPQPKSVENPVALFEKAGLLQKNGRLQKAKGLYEETLSLDPDHVDALNNLGVIYIHDKDYSAARAFFAKAIRQRPGYVDAYYNLACLHALKGELAESLSHLKKAVTLDKSVKDWARTDSDLQNLRGVPEFERITGKNGGME
jgi:tetratricopeptide (TPR) repeat protein